ncbi:MAG: PrsW family intramembrane metalloprotease [Spirochaetales bacterium]|nr:PrsW family intramembrane metalloprotease [Spirochaetales bacterium]
MPDSRRDHCASRSLSCVWIDGLSRQVYSFLLQLFGDTLTIFLCPVLRCKQAEIYETEADMTVILSLVIAIVPSLLLVFYFYRRDSYKKEPKRMILFAFFLGIVSIFPAVFFALALGFLEKMENPWLLSFIEAFITAALVEEVAKTGMLRFFIFRNPYFDEITDGIIYMAVISLGFACFENILYSIDDVQTALIRAFTAVPGHALWSGIMGYYFGLAKTGKDKTDRLFFKGLALGIFYHGLYDFVLFAGTKDELASRFSWMVYLIFPILIICVIHINTLLKRALQQDREIIAIGEETGINE